jgi:hypothetical protein
MGNKDYKQKNNGGAQSKKNYLLSSRETTGKFCKEKKNNLQ